MNLLGKIFTVTILVLSLVLMIVGVLVYSTHTNWRTEYDNINQRLSAATAANQELETSYTNQVNLLKAEQEAALQDVRKLESERVSLVAQNASIQTELDQLRLESRRATELVEATEENNNRLTLEVTQLREDIRKHLQARDDAFATTLKATTDLHVASGELANVQERQKQLVDDLANATSHLRELNVDPNGEVVARVRGLVSDSRRADGGQLIEITIGSDDGLRPGQTVEIFRGERYLGRAEILKADPDRAVARVMREFQQGQIQKGDDVATKLRVG